MDKLITQAVQQQQVIAPDQLVQVANYIAAAAFATDLIEVDEPLWGSFWQFDVISPGYLLPAFELALLRAIRLDHHWPEDTGVEQFLADLRRAILSPQAGVWTLRLAGAPWAVFAAEDHHPPAEKQPLITVVWYCASTGLLHAGYRVGAVSVDFTKEFADRTDMGAVTQRAPKFGSSSSGLADEDSAEWLKATVASSDIDEADEVETGDLTARFDRAILKFRSEVTGG